MKEIRVSARAIYVVTALTIAAFVGGFAMAGSLTIFNGTPEAANGNYEATTNIAWWSQASVGLSATPSSTLTVLSSTVSSPTTLATSNQAYLANSGTAGDVAHFFKMSETSSAPINTELEIVFTISAGSTPVITTVTLFVETQSAAPSGTLTFTIYYDLGSASSASVVLNSVQQISQVCGSLGNCP